MRSSARGEQSARLRRIYRRASFYYDWLDWPFEYFRYRRLRPGIWKGLSGRVLDLGAGTGRNVPFYPAGAEVTSADLSPEMLRRAAARIRQAGLKPRLLVTDALELGLQAGRFDACVSTFLFCVLPDAVQEKALREIKRVLKPRGKVILLEYVYSRSAWRRLWMRMLAPLTEWLYGARFDRRTRRHLVRAGFRIVEERFVHSDVLLKIVAEV